jgi:hypothetical protein
MTLRVTQIFKFGKSGTSYAVLFLDEQDIPSLKYLFDKNHEEHALNSFVKQKREQGILVYDKRIKQERTAVQVTVKVGDVERVYETEI